jgi:glutathione synthase/RimK-type ligase-like ATP-grasp enzyme
MPQNLLLDRTEVEQMAATSTQLSQFLVQDKFPILIRPVDSHAGQGLQKLSSHGEMAEYLKDQTAEQFYVSPYVDYASSDGQFRKYRIAFVAGKPFLCHMAISDQWMIHYLNAGMTESTLKRSEEAEAMLQFDQKFGLRHEEALEAVGNVFDLDYFAVDCAETRDGQLLIFEVGNAMVVHDMDPEAMFPYKKPLMGALFRDFQALLFEKAKPHKPEYA